MSGETGEVESGLTTDTAKLMVDRAFLDLNKYFERVISDQKDYFERVITERDAQYQQRFEAQQTGVSTALASAEKASDKAFAAAEKATDKAEEAQQLRNTVSNEFRGQLSDQAAKFAEKDSVDRAVASAEDKASVAIRGITDRLDGLDRRHTALDQSVTAFHAEYGGRDRGHSDEVQSKVALNRMVTTAILVVGTILTLGGLIIAAVKI